MHQLTKKYSKWPCSESNGRKMLEMTIKYTNMINFKALKTYQNFYFWYANIALVQVHTMMAKKFFGLTRDNVMI
jgi:hypothetical protein